MSDAVLCVAAVCAAACSVQAQQSAKPPKAQLWMDVSTGGMAGMPEMEMPAGLAGMYSSLVGEHRVQGDGVPASMRFTLGAAQDLMPPIELQTRGQLKDSLALNWRAVPQARAYYLHAMGQVGNDLVMWSSAETGDTGMGLLDYLPNATVDRWIAEKVLLRPDTKQCVVPRGIFSADAGRGEGSGALLRMVAYGSESNFVHPPRPTDPRAAWEPEWAVRVRVKANTMAQLGEDTSAAGPATRGGADPTQPTAPAGPAGVADSILPIPGAGNLLRGLFGR